DPDFVPEPIYPEYIPLEDEHILSAEEQPLPLVVSPTAESPGYVAESDPEEALEEYEDDETEDGPGAKPVIPPPSTNIAITRARIIVQLQAAIYFPPEAEQTEIAELRETDRRRQAQMAETLRVMGDMRRETGKMQAELLALREQPRRAG
nr:hypothetical protein [Tanacetum cinerariifolium]